MQISCQKTGHKELQCRTKKVVQNAEKRIDSCRDGWKQTFK